MELIKQLLVGTCAGEARLLFVTGEPGIGKTRLLAELLARAGERGCLALHGNAAEFERELPFGLVVDAVDEYLESLDPHVFQRSPARTSRSWAGCSPRSGRLSADPIAPARLQSASAPFGLFVVSGGWRDRDCPRRASGRRRLVRLRRP